MSSKDVKAELERKRAKLIAMREERLKREKNKYDGASKPPFIFKIGSEKVTEDVDAIIERANVRNKEINLRKSASANSILQQHYNPYDILKKLNISKLNECSVAPLEDSTYSKDTQTDLELQCESPTCTTETWAVDDTYKRGTLSSGKNVLSLEWDDDLLEDELSDWETNSRNFDEQEATNISKRRSFKDEKMVKFNKSKTEAKPPPSEKDKIKLMESEEFRHFVLRTSQIIECALSEELDIFFDYSGLDKDNSEDADGNLVKEEFCLSEMKWTQNRTVTALDWSITKPENLISAYCLNDDYIGNGQPGTCILWNLNHPTAPERVFTCQNHIQSAILSEFHPNLIIVGTYGGQIMLWDTRVNRQTPVQRTPFNLTSGHNEPIKALVMTGEQTANSLMSVSADGRMCTWSLDMLTAPHKTFELTYKQTKTVAATSMAFFPNGKEEVSGSSFLIGGQDGNVYTGAQQSSELNIIQNYESHIAPVTAVAIPRIDAMPPVFLSTAMDCSVKLWSTKESRYPIFCFNDNGDYYLDCDWSPVHPALFATVDLGGRLDIWNLNSNYEMPSSSTLIADGDVLLNRCKFKKNGSHLSVGDDTGKVRIFEIQEKLANPVPGEMGALHQTVEALSLAASEQRELDMHSLSYRFAQDTIG